VVLQYVPEHLWMKILRWLFSICSLFWIYTSRLMRSSCNLWVHVCVAVCLYVYPPLTTFECLNQSLWNLVCTSWHLIPSLLPVMSKLQPLNSLRDKLNIAWTPALVFVKFRMFITSHEGVSAEYLISRSHQ
jgi:hypothetical protein